MATRLCIKAYMDDHPIPAGRGSLVGRIIVDKRATQIVDVLADPEFTLPRTLGLVAFALCWVFPCCAKACQ